MSLAQLAKYIQAKATAGVLGYVELFDARDITLDLSLSDLQQLGSQVREAQGSLVPGKVAVVTNSNFVYGLATAYAGFTREENPQFKIFQSIEEAEAWLFPRANP